MTPLAHLTPKLRDELTTVAFASKRSDTSSSTKLAFPTPPNRKTQTFLNWLDIAHWAQNVILPGQRSSLSS